MILAHSETGAGPLDISLAEFAEQPGLHISDALAEWVLANGVGSLMVGTPEHLDEADIVRALLEPRTLPNINDSGAHQQLFAAAGEHVYLLTRYVRDAGLLRIETAVHALTGRPAEFFGLTDRGVVAPGKVADLARLRPRRDRARRRRSGAGTSPTGPGAWSGAPPASAPRSPPGCPRGSTARPPTPVRAPCCGPSRPRDARHPAVVRWEVPRYPWVAFAP